MAVIGISCDRCGSTIASDRTLLHVQTGPMRVHRPAVDLCLSCASDLVAFLAGGTLQPTEERPPQPARS